MFKNLPKSCFRPPEKLLKNVYMLIKMPKQTTAQEVNGEQVYERMKEELSKELPLIGDFQDRGEETFRCSQNDVKRKVYKISNRNTSIEVFCRLEKERPQVSAYFHLHPKLIDALCKRYRGEGVITHSKVRNIAFLCSPNLEEAKLLIQIIRGYLTLDENPELEKIDEHYGERIEQAEIEVSQARTQFTEALDTLVAQEVIPE